VDCTSSQAFDLRDEIAWRMRAALRLRAVR